MAYNKGPLARSQTMDNVVCALAMRPPGRPATAPFLLDMNTANAPRCLQNGCALISMCSFSWQYSARCVCMFTFMVCYRAELRQHYWCTWLCFGVKCYWTAISRQQNEQSWYVSLWLWDQIHCCIIGQKTLDGGNKPKGRKADIFCPLSLSVSLSFSVSDSKRITFIIFIQIMANSKSSGSINS